MSKVNTTSKMTKESFYFTHDYSARNDPKILELRAEHGLEGLGLYWCIVETLAEADDGYINPKLLGGLSIGYAVSKSKLQEIIDFMKEVELLREDDKGYYSKRMMEHKKIRKKLSDAGKKGAKSRWANRQAKGKPKSAHSLPNAKEKKVKESKVKESKVKSIVDTNVSMSDAPHPTHHRIDYQALIVFFNEETQGVFGKVMYPISEKRKSSIRARINEFGKDAFAEMIRKASKSNFLKGDSNKGFVAQFDWMIRPSNFQKIIEGNYDNRNKGYSGSTEASDEELMLHIKQGIARGIEENTI